MKLYISNSGLYEPVKHTISDAKNELRRAQNMHPHAPGDFAYAYYVNDLSNKIYDYIQELKAIESTIYMADKRYMELFDNQVEKVQVLSNEKIEPRKGLTISDI